MGGTPRRNAILIVTYSLLLAAAGFVAARFVAWQHEGWAGLWFAPALGPEFKGKIVMFKPGAVSNVFSGGPAQAAGLVAGDVLLAVNGIPTSNSEELAKLDDHLQVNDEIAYRVKSRDGSQATVQVRLRSPLRSRQILVSTLSSLAVAVVFCFLGTLVYWRKPEDERALVFYLIVQHPNCASRSVRCPRAAVAERAAAQPQRRS